MALAIVRLVKNGQTLRKVHLGFQGWHLHKVEAPVEAPVDAGAGAAGWDLQGSLAGGKLFCRDLGTLFE